MAEIVTGGVGTGYKWYTEPGNVQTLAFARNISSNVSGQSSSINLWSYPEKISWVWTPYSIVVSEDFATAPDSTLTAEKLIGYTNTNYHFIYRNYSLSAYDTWDDGSIDFSDTTNSFDEGGSGTEDDNQTYTFSVFFKADEYSKVRFGLQFDVGTVGEQNIFFDLETADGTAGTLFIPQGGITGDDYGSVPYGDGWYRAYITTTISFGFSELRAMFLVYNEANQLLYTGDGSSGMYMWGAKLNKGTIDPYVSQAGQTFYADAEFNVKTYALERLEDYAVKALGDTLPNPATASGFLRYFDNVVAGHYKVDAIARCIRSNINIITNQLKDDSHYTNILTNNGITIPAYTYGNRSLPTGLGGGLNPADQIYGLSSGASGEVETVTVNEGKIVKIYKRLRITGDITDAADQLVTLQPPFTMNEVVQKFGDAAVNGTVYGFHYDDNFKYLDVVVTGGTWAVADVVVGQTSNVKGTVSAIEDRIHIIDLKGSFDSDIPFKGYDSGAEATPIVFANTEAAVLDNTGGTLTVDTASMTALFEHTSVVYPEVSRQYIEVSKFAGLDITVGDRVASAGYTRLGITVVSGLNQFTVGNRLYKVNGGIQDFNTWGIITEVDLSSNFIYVAEYQGNFANGDLVGDYGIGNNFPVGYASVITRVVYTGQAAALVQDIRTVGINQRLYLSDIRGAFDLKDYVISKDGYRAAVMSKVDLVARVKRAFKGFDGETTIFPLSIDNGTQYLPDPAGHLLVFVNGILQPPGGTNAYTAYSDKIQFTEAPEEGASFTGFYVGKLRQLDDISFEFDSLRQSFNLKRNDVFYSLTLTDGVQSSTIRPENNIVVSLNGVIQEPGVGFEIVGSRIIFSEVPRVGSTFVGFSYVGSEADVDAAEVVPPVEPGDFIDIQGETADREVAVIESSNSLITFDYLGSVFGKDAKGQANLTSGYIEQVQVTFGGSGYTSRPNVRVDSISGFEGTINALVGVAGVEINSPGSGYAKPDISVETTVPDDWTAPDLSLYGEEEVDPETP